MSYERLRPTFTFDADRLAQLKTIAPEAFADGKINWGTLRAALGDYLEEEGVDAEHFGLFWPGKRAARRRASEPSHGTLIPARGEGVDEDTTHNIFIEADNLDALKLLQKAYAGRVKMIYIDPPYNTGNDFVYRDDFRETQETYLRQTGQIDDSLRPLTTNTKSDGRFHSNWLNMIYPRLLLARTLLRDDGVIFVSIDDNEVHNLRLIMDEIFGGESFVAQIVWQSRQSIQNDTDISVNAEYIVSYAKIRRQANRRLKESNVDVWYSEKSFAAFPLPLNKDDFSNPDNDPRGDWKDDPFDAPNLRPNLTYPILNPNTGETYWPPKGRCWRTEEASYQKLFADGRIIFGRTGNAGPKLKVFYNEKKEFGTVENTWFDGQRFGTATHGTRELQALFGGVPPFDSPKPTSLIKGLLKIASRNTDIILDFFAGSGTTAHAVMAQNAEDGGNRQFILVQLPEETGSDDYPTISAITAERIRRAGQKIADEKAARLPEIDAPPLDVGFRYYRFAPSHYRAWQDYDGQDSQALQTLFDQFETPLVEGWQPAHLLTEVLLQVGFPLDSRIETLTAFTANTVQRVASDFHTHSLYACFDATIADETIESLALQDADLFVCLDSALTDQSKARLSDVCNLRTI